MENWQRAFVLHTRTYSESSLLVDLFVENVGKVTILAKGARRKKSVLKGILQPFTPLIVQYSGQREIKNLRQVEAISLTLPLVSVFLYSAFYLNELLHRVLLAETEINTLFDDYLISLQQLAQQAPAENILRAFELALLENLGYHIDFFIVVQLEIILLNRCIINIYLKKVLSVVCYKIVPVSQVNRS